MYLFKKEVIVKEFGLLLASLFKDGRWRFNQFLFNFSKGSLAMATEFSWIYLINLRDAGAKKKLDGVQRLDGAEKIRTD